MNRKIVAAAVGLLALGALEFGMLGASASGLVGGAGHGLPPIAQRGDVLVTATPATVTSEVSSPGGPPDPGCGRARGANVSPPCAPRTRPPCNPSPGSAPINRPCVPPTPPSRPPCKPSPGGANVSPPCATPTPVPQCAPFVPSSPPCAPPSAARRER